MTLVLKVHQLLQAVAFLGDEVEDIDVRLSFKEFNDGSLHVWRTDAPEQGTVALEPTIPLKLAAELIADDTETARPLVGENDDNAVTFTSAFNVTTGQLELDFISAMACPNELPEFDYDGFYADGAVGGV